MMTIEKTAFQTEIRASDADSLAEAIALLQANQPVAVPTETVYGLAANAKSTDAVAAIYRAKGRPSFNPLIVHVVDAEQASKIADFDGNAHILAKTFWPGPLTLVLPISGKGRTLIAPAVTAGLDTIAIRCPAHPVMRTITQNSGLMLAAPSANKSGAISPTLAKHVVSSLSGKIPLVIDGGACIQGLESTIVQVHADGWSVLRHGPVTQDAIFELLGIASVKAPNLVGQVTAPGQLASHYAPQKPLRLNVSEIIPDEWLIGFGDVGGNDNLSSSGDLAEAAANLYAALHRADASGATSIAIAPVPELGMGAAINDRLRRAATR